MKTNRKFLCTFAFLAAAALLLFTGAGGDTAVYVTGTGKKYHTENCSSLRQSKIAINLEDAAQSGYGPCGICKPPLFSAALNDGNGGQKSAGLKDTDRPASLYRVNAANIKASAQADIARMLPAQVVQHIDGDTVRVRISPMPLGAMEIQSVETIRLLGVDTPETVHPNKPVQHFGKEASDFTKARLLDKNVYLAFDWDLRDRYGRLLAYIYTADGAENAAGITAGITASCFNAELVREGYAHAYTRFAFQFADEFRALEQEARRAKRGLWSE